MQAFTILAAKALKYAALLHMMHIINVQLHGQYQLYGVS